MLDNNETLIIGEMCKNKCIYLLFIVPLAICFFAHIFLTEQNKIYFNELDKLQKKIKEAQKKMKNKLE